MESHVYVFGTDIKLQRKGGPIGVHLTGTIEQIFMLWWDRELKTRMENLKIECRMYKRYVDDINMAIEITLPGITYKDNQI